MSYASSTINSIDPAISWSEGCPADGYVGSAQGTTSALTSGTIKRGPNVNLGQGIYVITANILITINDATTAWEPSDLDLYDGNNVSLGAITICGSATYNSGTELSQVLTLWIQNVTPTYVNPFYVGFTPDFSGSTVAPTAIIDTDFVKIR